MMDAQEGVGRVTTVARFSLFAAEVGWDTTAVQFSSLAAEVG